MLCVVCRELIPTHTPAPGGIGFFVLLCFALLGFSIVTLFFIHEVSQSFQIKILFLNFMIACDIVLGSLIFEFSYSLYNDENIGFDGYIGIWILRIYRWIFLHEYRYIGN